MPIIGIIIGMPMFIIMGFIIGFMPIMPIMGFIIGIIGMWLCIIGIGIAFIMVRAAYAVAVAAQARASDAARFHPHGRMSIPQAG